MTATRRNPAFAGVVIVTAFANVTDVKATLTPLLRTEGDNVLLLSTPRAAVNAGRLDPRAGVFRDGATCPIAIRRTTSKRFSRACRRSTRRACCLRITTSRTVVCDVGRDDDRIACGLTVAIDVLGSDALGAVQRNSVRRTNSTCRSCKTRRFRQLPVHEIGAARRQLLVIEHGKAFFDGATRCTLRGRDKHRDSTTARQRIAWIRSLIVVRRRGRGPRAACVVRPEKASPPFIARGVRQVAILREQV